MDNISNLFEFSSNLCFIQIGTNNGGDYFRDLCRKYTPEKVILIEPCTECNIEIGHNYEGINRELINAAVVVDENIKTIKLISSTGITAHSSILPMKSWENNEGKFVPTITIKNILTKYNIQKVDLLVIDTEGYDCYIVNYIFENNLQDIFKYIIFENWQFDNKEYNNSTTLIGSTGIETIRKLATNNNLKFCGCNFQLNGVYSKDIYKHNIDIIIHK